MTPLEAEIQQGTEILKAHRENLQKLSELKEKKDDKAMLTFLVDVYVKDCEGKCISVETRLAQLKKEQVVEFEKRSAECNMNMEKVLRWAKEWFGKEPKAITSRLEVLCSEYKAFMDQAKKNDLFFEIKGHLNFLKNKYQNK